MKRCGTNWGSDGAAEFGFELPKVELEITVGPREAKTLHVRSAAFLVGAAADCDLILADARFGAVHCYLLLKRREVIVRHLGFGPALRVSGQDVTWAALCDNDRLQTGPYEFRVRIDWPEQVRETPASGEGSPRSPKIPQRLLSDLRRQFNLPCTPPRQ
jgi:hypothetical protein